MELEMEIGHCSVPCVPRVAAIPKAHFGILHLKFATTNVNKTNNSNNNYNNNSQRQSPLHTFLSCDFMGSDLRYISLTDQHWS